MKEKKIALGCDHAGFEMKSLLAGKLSAAGWNICDVGTDGTDSVDYPVFAKKVAVSVASGECDAGILVCGSGIGMSMAANKVKGVRAFVCSEPLSAELSRRHNDSNILCLGGRLIGIEMAWRIVETWLTTEFEGGRHVRRVCMIDED